MASPGRRSNRRMSKRCRSASMSGSSARDAVPGEGRDYLVVSVYGLHGRTLTPAAAPAAAGVTA
jgi:hypothetical protein